MCWQKTLDPKLRSVQRLQTLVSVQFHLVRLMGASLRAGRAVSTTNRLLSHALATIHPKSIPLPDKILHLCQAPLREQEEPSRA